MELETTIKNKEIWIQLATLLAVIVGVVLVVWELRQSHQMTYAQLVHGNMSELSQERSTVYGEELGTILKVACYEPESLTRTQGFILDAYFSNQINRVSRFKIQSEIGKFATPWRSIGKAQVLRVLSFPQGKKWLSNHPIWSSAAADQVVREYLQAFEQDFLCNTLIDIISPNAPLALGKNP